MERELWLRLYQVVRNLDPAPCWLLGKFFRLGDRGRLFMGGDSRSTSSLGLRGEELGFRLVEAGTSVAVDDEPSTADDRGATTAEQSGGCVWIFESKRMGV